MHLFFTPDISRSIYTLNKDDSRHCAKVLRLEMDDVITLTDGRGNFYHSRIIDNNPKAVTVELIEKEEEKNPWPQHIHMVIAPTKNISRTEWAVEKCTEMGVDEITTILTMHSERTIVKHDRMNRVITAAVKQSLKASHPVLHETKPFKEFVKEPFAGQKFIAYIDEKYTDLLAQAVDPEKDIMVLIGPEGDFSEEEVNLALENGFKPVSLGHCRLRTETAMVAACQTIHTINQLKGMEQ